MDEALLPAHEEQCSLPWINSPHVFNHPISNEDQFMHNATAKERGYNVGVGIGFGGRHVPTPRSTLKPRTPEGV